eukprot:Awhi_evm1s8210
MNLEYLNLQQSAQLHASILPSPNSQVSSAVRSSSILPKKKRNRRTFSQLKREYVCHYVDCGRPYASDHSLQQHLKLKHGEKGSTKKNNNSNFQPLDGRGNHDLLSSPTVKRAASLNKPSPSFLDALASLNEQKTKDDLYLNTPNVGQRQRSYSFSGPTDPFSLGGLDSLNPNSLSINNGGIYGNNTGFQTLAKSTNSTNIPTNTNTNFGDVFSPQLSPNLNVQRHRSASNIYDSQLREELHRQRLSIPLSADAYAAIADLEPVNGNTRQGMNQPLHRRSLPSPSSLNYNPSLPDLPALATVPSSSNNLPSLTIDSLNLATPSSGTNLIGSEFNSLPTISFENTIRQSNSTPNIGLADLSKRIDQEEHMNFIRQLNQQYKREEELHRNLKQTQSNPITPTNAFVKVESPAGIDTNLSINITSPSSFSSASPSIPFSPGAPTFTPPSPIVQSQNQPQQRSPVSSAQVTDEMSSAQLTDEMLDKAIDDMSIDFMQFGLVKGKETKEKPNNNNDDSNTNVADASLDTIINSFFKK